CLLLTSLFSSCRGHPLLTLFPYTPLFRSHQRIDRFLQHALLVAHNDFRRVELKQAAQAVVAVDDAAVQIVEVGGREAATIQRHRSEEHTSELQSREKLVCRLLREKKKRQT